MRSNTASSWPGTAMSIGMKIGRFHLARERLHMRLGLFVEIGDRKLGAEGVEGSGATPGDRTIVGDADDQPFSAPEKLRIDDRNGH